MTSFFSFRNRPSQRHRRGAEAVEFALILPILILLTLGTLELGRSIWIWHSLQEALNITGRYAMYNAAASNTQLQSYFGQKIKAVPASDVKFVFTPSSTGTMNFTTITASYVFVPVTTFIPSFSFTLTSTTRIPRVQ